MSVIDLWIQVAIFIVVGISFVSLIFFLRRRSKNKGHPPFLSQHDVSEFMTRPIHLDDYYHSK